ncbi:FAD-dependent oxidoreductase, partial [Mycoplasmopsis synoviae]
TIIYLNGLSTSMANRIQMQFLKTIPGIENLKIQKYGYGIEYDALNSLDLKHSLETKVIKNFFAPGQTNGTSGYEEAAAQGLIAGINAALKLKNKKPL